MRKVKFPFVRRSKVSKFITELNNLHNLTIELATEDGVFIGPLTMPSLYLIVKYGHDRMMEDTMQVSKDGTFTFRAWIDEL